MLRWPYVPRSAGFTRAQATWLELGSWALWKRDTKILPLSVYYCVCVLSIYMAGSCMTQSMRTVQSHVCPLQKEGGLFQMESLLPNSISSLVKIKKRNENNFWRTTALCKKMLLCLCVRERGWMASLCLCGFSLPNSVRFGPTISRLFPTQWPYCGQAEEGR